MSDLDDPVARYYEANTKRFLSLGQGKSARALHRAVWGEGVESRHDAMHFVNELIYRDMERCKADFAVDLGCGVGGSLLYLAQRSSSLSGCGITLSRVQAQISAELLKRGGQEDRIKIVHGNMLDAASYENLIPVERSGPLFVFAVESLIHLESADQLFQTVSPLLRSKDRFAICDDFLSSKLPAGQWETPMIGRWFDEYRRGWKVHSLVTPDQLLRQASSHGFDNIARLNLTPYLELNRPRDRLIRALVALGRQLKPHGEWWSSLLGGNALQACIKEGVVEYWYILLEKRDSR